ncbi:MAG: hypothetical protein AAB340_00615 [Patescibacteria group bacterium]
MDVSHLMNECADPEDSVCREKFKKEFLRLVERYGLEETTEAIVKNIYDDPEIRQELKKLHRQGATDDEVAEVLGEITKELIEKMLFNKNPV